MTKKLISVSVVPDFSPRIENWLMGRDIEYEVQAIGSKLKIMASFSTNEKGKHQAEMYKRFLDRMKKGGK